MTISAIRTDHQLRDDLTTALTAHGHGPVADDVAQLLYPAGQAKLLAALQKGELDELLARWIGELAEKLQSPVADVAHVRDLLTGATR